MNLDQTHHNGKPNQQSLSGFNTVRLPLRWRKYQGQSVTAALAQQTPYINDLLAWGKRVILVITHEFGLEGQGYDWTRMSPDDWARLIAEFNHNLTPILVAFGSRVVYQIWNEPDGTDGRASVLMPAAIYGTLFKQAYSQIRAAASNAQVITAGFKTGPQSAVKYFRDSGITQASAIAIHEYGRGGMGNPDFAPFGKIEDTLAHWRLFTNLPIWITEWGILNNQPPVDKAARYAADFLRGVKKYSQVKEQCFFAWGNQDNGYAAYDKPALIQALTVNWTGSTPAPAPSPAPVPSGDEWVRYRLDGSMNYRSLPTTKNNTPLGVIRSGSIIWVDERSFERADGYAWKRCYSPTLGYGWTVIYPGVNRIPV